LQEFKINILGSEYHIKSDADEDHMLAIISYLQQVIDNTVDNSDNISKTKAIILSAIKITSELIQSKSCCEQLIRRIEDKTGELENIVNSPCCVRH